MNALDEPFVDALCFALDSACSDESIAVLHIRSARGAFCAGADLAFMQACFRSSDGPERMIALVRRMQALFASIEAAPVVTVAEIGGAAMGGGLELALACDLRVAATEAKLGFPEAGLGLLPAAGGTQRLTRVCGPGVAKRLILGAEIVSGAEAARLGIVQWAQSRAELSGWTSELAARIGALPRNAVRAIKACIAAAGDPDRDGYAEEIDHTAELYRDAETRRRVNDFLDKNASTDRRDRR